MLKLLILLFIFSLTAQTFADAIPFVGFDLEQIDENQMKEARLLALKDETEPFHEEKIPLILVHGIKGDPKDMQSIVNRLRHKQYQLYVLAYDDYHQRASTNGSMFAQEIRKLKSKKLVIVAHSMGGIVARKAIVDLIKSGEISNYDSVRSLTIDTPWHGFEGPEDESFKLKMAKRFLPAGLIDMRARSGLFKELNLVTFPENVRFDIAFAQEGKEALDYTDNIKDPVMKDNLKRALELTGKFSPDDMTEVFPRFPGNHLSVLENDSFLNYLEENLCDTSAGVESP